VLEELSDLRLHDSRDRGGRRYRSSAGSETAERVSDDQGGTRQADDRADKLMHA